MISCIGKSRAKGGEPAVERALMMAPAGRLDRALILSALLLPALLACPVAGSAQTGSHAHAPGQAPWLLRWSPLPSIADQPRMLPPPVRLPGLLSEVRPAVGVFWTAGNPAGLALDVREASGSLAFSGAGAEGDYRRPLDAADVDALRLAGLRVQPLGDRSSVAGRVVLERTLSGDGAMTPAIFRHGSDPFVVADSSTSGMRHVRARLEGAYGVHAGPWAAGVALGVEVADDRTRAARLSRMARASLPGVSVGVGRTVRDGAVLALHGRWVGGVESFRVLAPPAVVGEVYNLRGYDEPVPIRITQQQFVRFVERDAWAVGGALAGEARGARWALFGERASREHGHAAQRRPGEPMDRWIADGWRAGGAAAGMVADGRLAVGLNLAYERLEGDATRADVQGVIFRAAESAVRSALDVRWLPLGAWSAGGRAEVGREARVRRDFVTDVSSDIAAWTAGGALEVARRLGPRTDLSLGGGITFYAPTWALMDPARVGPVYASIIAPELGLYATPARAVSGGLSFRYLLEPPVRVVAAAGLERIIPSHGSAPAPLAAGGVATGWRISVGGLWQPALTRDAPRSEP